MTAPSLDHVGVVGNDLAALATAYERLGFTLTPRARYADGRIGNRCVMLRGSYIELLAVIDPIARSATLERFLACYAGVHILAFAIANEQSAMERLRRAGIEQATVNRFSDRSTMRIQAARRQSSC
jgi:Glyoxalase-like domain